MAKSTERRSVLGVAPQPGALALSVSRGVGLGDGSFQNPQGQGGARLGELDNRRFAIPNTFAVRLRESPRPFYRSAALVKVLLERLRRAHRALRVLRSTLTMLATQGSGS